MCYTKDDVRRVCRDIGVKLIRLQFTDIFGILKSVSITLDQLDKALNGELTFDGSSIEGFVRIEESDMYLRPDPNTFVVFPWKPREGAVARLICDIYNADGSPFAGDPRYILRQTVREAAETGYVINVGAEAEFFLFQLDPAGKPTTHTHDQAGYFDLTPVDLGEDARREMILIMDQMEFEIEASHHEVASGQHEIDFKYAGALDMADRIMTFKFIVRSVAQRHGLHATFMPKPFSGMAGSGLHLNMSLMQEDRNIFYNPDRKWQLSPEALGFLAGVMHHIPAATAVVNPTVNSYKRLISGYEAPVHINWSTHNRNPLIRIPAERGRSTRIELRSPDPACNPYLALAVCLKAGLAGIKQGLLPPPCDENEPSLGVLPENLQQALRALAGDDLVKAALGPHIVDRFMEAKQIEWNRYQTRVHQWELEEYLTKF